MENEKNNLMENIKSYIKYDNYIRNQEKILKNIKKKRDIYSQNILENIINKRTNNKIRVGDSVLICNEIKTLSGLNQKFIKENLYNFFKDNYKNMTDTQINEISAKIYEYIIASRKISKKLILKRIFK